MDARMPGTQNEDFRSNNAVGLGLIPDLECTKQFIPVAATYKPDMKKHAKYKPYYKTFKKLYAANKSLFKAVSK